MIKNIFLNDIIVNKLTIKLLNDPIRDGRHHRNEINTHSKLPSRPNGVRVPIAVPFRGVN